MRPSVVLDHAELAAMTDEEIRTVVNESARRLSAIQAFSVHIGGKLILGSEAELVQQVIHHVRNEAAVPRRTEGMG